MPKEKEKEKKEKKSKKQLQSIGARKRAVARATIKQGTGKVRINSIPLDMVEPRYCRMRIQEALILAEPHSGKVNIDVNVFGGGVWGQADAARTAIANAIVEFTKSTDLKQKYIEYDRFLTTSNSRRTEPHKPSRSSAGPRRSKQQSKR